MISVRGVGNSRSGDGVGGFVMVSSTESSWAFDDAITARLSDSMPEITL